MLAEQTAGFGHISFIDTVDVYVVSVSFFVSSEIPVSFAVSNWVTSGSKKFSSMKSNIKICLYRVNIEFDSNCSD